MNDPEPTERGGVMDFAKRIAGRAVESAQAVRANPMPDRTPGIRWLRKRRRAGDPRAAHACACSGCQCSTMVAGPEPCSACARGRHRVSLLSKSARRTLAGPARSVRKVDPRRRTPAQRKAARRTSRHAVGARKGAKRG